MTEEQLSALLRLKRYEKPPEGYFEDFLGELHRRQRAELLKRSLWQLAWERVQTFFGEHSMGGLAYSGAMAGLLVLGVSVIGLMTPAREPGSGGTFAKVDDTRMSGGVMAKGTPKSVVGAGNGAVASSNAGLLQLAPQTAPIGQGAPGAEPVRYIQAQPLPVAERGGSRYSPRYVIDARPASYEPSFNF